MVHNSCSVGERNRTCHTYLRTLMFVVHIIVLFLANTTETITGFTNIARSLSFQFSTLYQPISPYSQNGLVNQIDEWLSPSRYPDQEPYPNDLQCPLPLRDVIVGLVCRKRYC
eukprot:TRINITY_DN2284_c0_g2_i11.p1 TRINITY_DN2284_c0_g2~~TRINITY_DN2284_c0_g2_i11.p1  ORF type:complete len:113 (-),score=8.38 TRINITY_DN2284_c0_g2_i11:159-497(-)